jgi:endonuclease/exonuclease/phosphatase (EEP) superfamily protein YafD
MINIVSYNVLSSHLSSPNSFPRNNPEDLKPSNRLYKLKLILKQYINTQSPIFLLQEVSISWSEELQVFFHQENYTFIVSNYGNYYTGHMGVAIAFSNVYRLLKVANRPITSSLAWPPVKAEEDWARVKYNTKRWLGVYLHYNDKSFWVTTCHLPCVFTNPEITNTYVYAFLHSLNSIVGQSPVILGGDFNFTQSSDAHMTMTMGGISDQVLNIYDYSPMNWPMPKTNGFKRVPIDEFTCHSCIRFGDEEPQIFKGTIDHIYYRNLEFQSRGFIDQPSELLPTSYHPSDHLVVSSTFVLK